MLRVFFICLCILLSSCGLVRKKPSPEEELRKRYFSHTISYSGESLSLIAEWYTGSAKNWEKILAHNANIQANRLRIGQTVDIPREMLIKTEVLPKSQVKKSPTKAKVPNTPKLNKNNAPSKKTVEAKSTANSPSAAAQEPVQERTKRRDDLLDELLRE